MLPALAALALAAAPSLHCGHCELNAPSVARLERANTHTLLAQAELPPPPLPSAEVPSAEGPEAKLPALPPPAASLRSRQALELRIDDLNREIRGINVNWPTHLILIAYAGYVIAPACLLGGGMLGLVGLVGLTASSSALAIVGVGALVFLVGVAGVAAIIYAWTAGNAQQQEARKHRDALIREREAAEAELRALRSDWQPAPTPPGGLVTLLTF